MIATQKLNKVISTQDYNKAIEAIKESNYNEFKDFCNQNKVIVKDPQNLINKEYYLNKIDKLQHTIDEKIHEIQSINDTMPTDMLDDFIGLDKLKIKKYEYIISKLDECNAKTEEEIKNVPMTQDQFCNNINELVNNVDKELNDYANKKYQLIIKNELENKIKISKSMSTLNLSMALFEAIQKNISIKAITTINDLVKALIDNLKHFVANYCYLSKDNLIDLQRILTMLICDQIKPLIKNSIDDWLYAGINLSFINEAVSSKSQIKDIVKLAFKFYNKHITNQKDLPLWFKDVYYEMNIHNYFDEEDINDDDDESNESNESNAEDISDDNAKTFNDFVLTIPENTYILPDDMLTRYNNYFNTNISKKALGILLKDTFIIKSRKVNSVIKRYYIKNKK